MAVDPSSVPRVKRLSRSEEIANATIDEQTGEIREHACLGCHRLSTHVAGLERDLDATQDKLTQAFTQIKALKTQDENRRAKHRRRTEVVEVFEHWQQTCGKQRSKLTNERFDVIASRLNNDYGVDALKLASVGAAHNNPWKPRQGQPRMVEIATFLSRGDWLEQFANAGAAWQNRTTEPGPRRLPDQRPPINRVLDALPGDWRAASSPDCWMAQCPAHDDSGPSLSIRREVGLDGELVLLNCFAGCDTGAVVEALGLGFADLFESTLTREQLRPRSQRPKTGLDPHLRRALDDVRAWDESQRGEAA